MRIRPLPSGFSAVGSAGHVIRSDPYDGECWLVAGLHRSADRLSCLSCLSCIDGVGLFAGRHSETPLRLVGAVWLHGANISGSPLGEP